MPMATGTPPPSSGRRRPSRCSPSNRRVEPCRASAARDRALEQEERLDLQFRRDPLDRAQGQVALAALDPGPVGAVEAEAFGERLLAQLFRFPKSAEVLAQRGLKFALHEP